MNASDRGLRRMRKLGTLRSLVAIFSISGLVVGISCFAERRIDGNTVGLEGLYWLGGDPYGSYPNFLQMTDGAVIFFLPGRQADLSSVMAGQTPNYTGLFQVFSPSSKTSRLVILTVKRTGGTLQFGSFLAKNSEVERLMLSPSWQTVINFLRSRNEVIRGSSIARLKEGLFLITGGTAEGLRGTSNQSDPKTATVYDTTTKRVVKTFQLCHEWNNHLSLVLPDGRVLLVASVPIYVTSSDPSVEIVDIARGASRSLKCRTIGYRASPTACLDENGAWILLGGAREDKYIIGSDFPNVQRINVDTEEIEQIAELKIPRHFNESGQNRLSPLNAIVLPNNTILVSGGRSFISDLLHPYGLDMPKNAELVPLQK